jgi:hypothetical protein
MKEEEDLLLDVKGKERIIKNLKKHKFESFKVHGHYWKFENPKLGPRHGVGLDQAKKIFNQFDKIIAISKRKLKKSFGYCVIYKVSNRTYYKLLFFLDEKPK